ncbi:MAG: DUF2341 domain-containing protein [Chitinivibrionales bacterium]|nr:DUF2341 domain-containing protein [Chitinivibrionales bacterium]
MRGNGNILVNRHTLGSILHPGFDRGNICIGIGATDLQTYSTVRSFVLAGDGGSVAFNDLTLDSGAQVRGHIQALGYARLPKTFVQVRGLERLAVVDSSSDSLFLPLVPREMLDIRIVPSDGNLPITEHSLHVSAARVEIGTLVSEPLHRARRMTLNAASITSDLYDFPLCVRLDASWLDFSLVGPGGDGLRFYRNNTELQHEIELWDSAGSQGVVWVRVDTVKGGSQQELVMTWQTSVRSAFASSTHVFDTSQGFMAVWHLGEESPGMGAVGLFRDATANGYNGTDSVLSAAKEGIIGKGQHFGGGIDYIPIAGQVAPSGTFTLSAWFKLDTIDQNASNPANIISTYDWNNDNPNGFVIHVFRSDLDFIAGDGTPRVSAAAWNRVTPGWIHYAVVYQPGTGTVKMYVNGVAVPLNNPAVKNSIVYASAQTYISSPTSQSFRGALDEIRVESTVRSDDWVRLSYENQRPDQRVVVVR